MFHHGHDRGDWTYELQAFEAATAPIFDGRLFERCMKNLQEGGRIPCL